jgi:hypothetical protein
MAKFIELPRLANGGDVTELRDFADHLTNRSIPEFESVLSGIDQRISSTSWSGQDAINFIDQWDEIRNRVRSICSELEYMSGKALAQAQTQENVSQL